MQEARHLHSDKFTDFHCFLVYLSVCLPLYAENVQTVLSCPKKKWSQFNPLLVWISKSKMHRDPQTIREVAQTKAFPLKMQDLVPS